MSAYTTVRMKQRLSSEKDFRESFIFVCVLLKLSRKVKLD